MLGVLGVCGGSPLNCMPPSCYGAGGRGEFEISLRIESVCGVGTFARVGVSAGRLSAGGWAWAWARAGNFGGVSAGRACLRGVGWKPERTLCVFLDPTGSCVSSVGAWPSSWRKEPLPADGGRATEPSRAPVLSLGKFGAWGGKFGGTFLSRLLRPFVWPHGGELGWDSGLWGS